MRRGWPVMVSLDHRRDVEAEDYQREVDKQMLAALERHLRQQPVDGEGVEYQHDA